LIVVSTIVVVLGIDGENRFDLGSQSWIQKDDMIFGAETVVVVVVVVMAEKKKAQYSRTSLSAFEIRNQ
jgi:hypothetical protein